MKFTKTLLALALTTAFACPQSALAEEADAALKEMVVTATKSAKIANRIDKTLTASLAIRNLFDREHFQGSSLAEGHSVYLGLGFKY